MSPNLSISLAPYFLEGPDGLFDRHDESSRGAGRARYAIDVS
jgi:hypothetical protein